MTNRNNRRKRHLAFVPPEPPQLPPVPAFYPAPASADQLWGGLSMTTLSDRNATVASVGWMADPSRPWEITRYTGSAKREPGDTGDLETARLLATSRALRKLSDKLGREARERVEKAEFAKSQERLRASMRAIRKTRVAESKPAAKKTAPKAGKK